MCMSVEREYVCVCAQAGILKEVKASSRAEGARVYKYKRGSMR